MNRLRDVVERIEPEKSQLTPKREMTVVQLCRIDIQVKADKSRDMRQELPFIYEKQRSI
jgi:hypothetical protein